MKKLNIVQIVVMTLMVAMIWSVAFGALVTRATIVQDYSMVVPAQQVEQFIRNLDPTLEQLRGQIGWQVASNGDLLVFDKSTEPLEGVVDIDDVDTLFELVKPETSFNPPPQVSSAEGMAHKVEWVSTAGAGPDHYFWAIQDNFVPEGR